MIRCVMDVSIPETDKCAFCCIHCQDTDCEHRCHLSKSCRTEEDVFESDCVDAVEW